MKSFQVVYSLDLDFSPCGLCLDPWNKVLLVTRHVDRKESENTFDYLKINLRIKDDWKFNMNDALIQTFTTLSTDNADELARYEELIP